MAFEELALAYDNAIDWEQRLKREIPFLVDLIDGKGEARILDLACGSGRHAVALAQQGYKVVGLDTSKSMIKAARKLARKEKVTIDFLVADMAAMKEAVVGEFDFITCLGNSLALLPSYDVLKKTVAAAHSLLGNGGMFVVQTLNFAEIRKSGFRFFPLKGGNTENGSEVIFTRFFELTEHKDTVTMVLASFMKQTNGWASHVSTQQVLQLDKSILENALRKAGFSQVKFYGSYARQPFLPEESRNILFVAEQ